MKFARFSLVSAYALAVATAANAQIVSTLEPEDPVNLNVQSVKDFKKGYSAIQADAQSGNASLAFDPKNGVSVKVADGNVGLLGPWLTALGKLQYMVSLKDGQTGDALEITPDDISVFLNQQPAKYKFKSVKQAKLPSSVIVVMDRSGSMAGAIGKVQEAASYLFDQMPTHMSCQAITFADTHDWYGNPDIPCTASNVGLPTITAGGGTNLYEALQAAYEELNTRNDHVQKAVIVLTDGQPSITPAKEIAEKLKGDTQTLLFWLGDKFDQAETLFAPLADHYVDDSNGALNYLHNYFDVYSDAINKQAVITIDPQPKRR